MKLKFEVELAYCIRELQMCVIYLNKHSKVLGSKSIVFIASYLAVAVKYILL